MNRIKLSEYNPGMGILIDVQHPEDYMKNPTLGSVKWKSSCLFRISWI